MRTIDGRIRAGARNGSPGGGRHLLSVSPRVEKEDFSNIGDVQRFEMVLRPHGGEKVRLLIVGRKRLPETERHERHWGFVEAITDKAKDLKTELRGKSYETATRGERWQPAQAKASTQSRLKTARCISPTSAHGFQPPLP